MKPFTFMTVVLGLILGFLFASSRATLVPDAGAAPQSPRVATVRYVIDDDRDTDVRAEREEAEGLPVPIVPGTRVTEAEIKPPKRRGAKVPAPGPRPRPIVASRHSSTARPIAGLLSATEERARDNARLQLEREVTEWLTPEIPTSWKPPAPLITAMILSTQVKPIVKEYATVYEATLEADFSTARRDEIRAVYRRELVARRLTVLAGALGFLLACLAAVAGYIRADEATKGYYTPWLRAIATAGVGASGVLIYQILT